MTIGILRLSDRVKRPVYHLEVARETDAPFEEVAAALEEGGLPGVAPAGAAWGLKAGALRLDYQVRRFGVLEQGSLEVGREGDRVRLVHRARFAGWSVLILAGWWRLRRHRIWERFVARL